MKSGVVNIYKESGPSSSAIVGKVKRALGTRAVGHMGTLDPMGEGVLLVGVGKGTRLFEYYLSKTKTYEATFRFGCTSDTLDVTGNITAETAAPTQEQIERVLPLLVGTQNQIPPSYSAKSVGGVRAYKLAREGKAPQLKPVEITVNSLELIKEVGENEYLFRIDCSSGTYIRSLCRDLAEMSGSLGLMTSIKRTRCGNFRADDAVRVENVTMSDIIPLEIAISDLKRYDLADNLYKKVVNGVPVEIDGIEGNFALFCRNELIGIAENTPRGVRIKTYLKEDQNADR